MLQKLRNVWSIVVKLWDSAKKQTIKDSGIIETFLLLWPVKPSLDF